MGGTCSVYASNSHSKPTDDELIHLLSPDLDKEFLEETHHELFRISIHAPEDYKNLILDIKSKNLNLEPHHINQIFQLIRIEKKIFHDAFFAKLKKSCELIDIHQSEYQTSLNDIHNYFQEYIQTQSLENDFLHHGYPHVLEVEHRMHLILQKLEIFSEKDCLNILIRQLILQMVKYHDLIQLPNDHYNSPEEHTAIICKQHLFSLFQLETNHPLYDFIDYLSQMIIVIGTTDIWGAARRQHMNLSRLFFQFRELTFTYEPLELSPATQIWYQNLSCVVLIMGIIDKYPAALTGIVEHQMQQTNDDLTGLPNPPPKIKKLYCDMLKKQLFIQSHSSEFYFQSFLIAVVRHIAIQLELFSKKNPTQAHAFFSFIDMCRDLLIHGETLADWFKESIGQHHIDYLFTQIFIKKIPQEINFCESLKSDLLFSKNYLKRNFPHAHPIILDTTLNMNIEFLKTLEAFFSHADFDSKLEIIIELVINLVLQKGFILVLQNKKDTQIDSLRTNTHRYSLYSPTSTQKSVKTINLSHCTK